jgi:hypothetical protein
VDKETFAALRATFSADWVGADESLETIREVYQRYGYLLDPHSAVGWRVAERLRGTNPVVVASTAHWAKFGADVYRALSGLVAKAPLPDEVGVLGGLGIATLIAERAGARIDECAAEDVTNRIGAHAAKPSARAAGSDAYTAEGVVGARAATRIADMRARAAPLPTALAALASAPVRFGEVVEGNASAAEQAVDAWLARR